MRDKIEDAGEWGLTRKALWGWKPVEPNVLARPLLFTRNRELRWVNISLDRYEDANRRTWWGWSLWHNAMQWPEKQADVLCERWDVALALALSEGGLR
jgi:hypothetical protein